MTIFSFFLGLVVGSFINVVVRRGERGESLGGRSHCESCGKTLSFLELIPVFSFLIQKGRCRGCGSAFSRQYPLVELGTGILYALSAWFFLDLPFDFSSFFLALAAFLGIGAVIVIFVSDIRSRIIPNGAVFTLFILGLVRLAYTALVPDLVFDLVWNIGTALTIALFLAALWFFSGGRWMGFGDVKLIFATSLILGFPMAIAAFLLAFWIGGLYGIILIVSRQKTLQSQIPFGPFILIGAAAAHLFLQDIKLLSSIIAIW